MASVRKLKKDIDCLIFEVISDCFSFGTLHPEEKADEVTAIIADAVVLRNELIGRVNKSEKSDDPKVIRSYFNNLNKDLFVGVDKLCGRLSAVTGGK
jgi:hypothetical protein